MIGAMVAYRPLYMLKRKIHSAAIRLFMSVNPFLGRRGRSLAGLFSDDCAGSIGGGCDMALKRC